MYLCSAFLDRGKVTLSRIFAILSFSGPTLCGIMVWLRKLNCSSSKWHFAIFSFILVFCMHAKIASRFLTNCWGHLL